MLERRKSPVAVIIFLAIPLVLALLYLVGYFQLSKPWTGIYLGPPVVIRCYAYPIVGWLYYPAAVAESKLKRKDVMIKTAYGRYDLYSVKP